MIPDHSKAIDVFIAYAHEDELHHHKLTTHLSTLRQQGLITYWHDGDIVAGTESLS